MKIGVFADVHYSKDTVKGSRRCDLGLRKIEAMKPILSECDFSVNLGDLTDSGTDMLKSALKALEPLKIYHVLGNHDAFAGGRELFPEAFYSVCRDGWTLVFLDTNYYTDGTPYEGTGRQDWTECFVPEAQADFLRKVLSEAEKAVVFLHAVLDLGADNPHTVRNAEEISKIIRESGSVKAVFQGHYHPGGFSKAGDIPCYTMKSVCENGEIAEFATVGLNDGVEYERRTASADA